jgi:hypothetical protein
MFLLLFTVKYSREVDATDEDIERTRADLRARLRQLQELQGDEEGEIMWVLQARGIGVRCSRLRHSARCFPSVILTVFSCCVRTLPCYWC